MIENVYKNALATKSGYIPPGDVVEMTKLAKRDYGHGHSILTRPWIELNDRSVIDDENRGQLMFNAFVDTSVEDPAEAWKWRGTRSMARNKGIAMHANITANFLLPLFIAQNDDDEIDQEFSEVMRDIIEWMALPNNSEYQSSFLQIVFGMMTNPVTYLGAEFSEIYQTIKEKKEDGTLNMKKVIDEVLSGFQCPIWSSSQVLITNAYERNIQKQRSIIKRRFVERSELEAKYGTHKNWGYVKTGWKTIYSDNDGLFYDIKDMQHPLLVEEVTRLDRQSDSEVCFLGGIYMGDDNVNANPIRHRDNRGNPKYNVTPFGYSRIGEHFFYYKSMMNIVGWDNQLYDAMTELVMNRSILEVDMPIAISGSDKVDSDIVFPKAVIAFEDPKTKITPLLPPANIGAGMSALAMTKTSMDNESISGISSGEMPSGSTKGMAYVLATVQASAQKIIGEVAKSLAESVAHYGDLMKDIAINHITLPEVEELTGGQMRLKYKSFLLENKSVGGRTMNKHIMFDQTLIGAEMTDEEKDRESLKMLEESNFPDSKQSLHRINPALFAQFKYLSRVDIEEMHSKNKEFWQPILTNLYTMLAQDPLADHEWLLRKVGHAYFNSEGDKLVKKQPQQNANPALPPGGVGAPPAAGETPQGGAPVKSNVLGQMAQSRALSTTLQPGAHP